MRSCGLHFFYIEKCSDMLEDCINALWDNGVNDDTLSLILYQLKGQSKSNFY